jgi:Tol biopolymer transport system component
VAVVRRNGENGGSDLWVMDLRRNVASRLTFNGLGVRSPVWSPDGSRITFFVPSGGETGIRQVSARGSGQSELLLKTPASAILEGWSPDGRMLLYTALERGKRSVWTLPADGDRRPQPVVQGEFNYGQASLSPDGRWVAYVSDESGRDEVYVRAFPPTEERWIVSGGGGSQPRWRRDGREIFFVSPQRMLTGVPVSTSERIELGSPERLFHLPGNGAYQGSPGDGFLVAVPADAEQSPIHVVMNWLSK